MNHPERLYQVVAEGLPNSFPEPRTNAPVPVAPGRQNALAEKINAYVEGSLAKALAEQPTTLDLVKTVLEQPSSKERPTPGERSPGRKVEGFIYLFFIVAFGLVGLVWLIKILFF